MVRRHIRICHTQSLKKFNSLRYRRCLFGNYCFLLPVVILLLIKVKKSNIKLFMILLFPRSISSKSQAYFRSSEWRLLLNSNMPGGSISIITPESNLGNFHSFDSTWLMNHNFTTLNRRKRFGIWFVDVYTLIWVLSWFTVEANVVTYYGILSLIKKTVSGLAHELSSILIASIFTL